MSDTLSFAELDSQHVELLPPRTVMSMLTMGGDGSGGSGGNGGNAIAISGPQIQNVGIVNLGGSQQVTGTQTSIPIAVAGNGGNGGNGHFFHFVNIHRH
jgi:hypothetical protein